MGFKIEVFHAVSFEPGHCVINPDYATLLLKVLNYLVPGFSFCHLILSTCSIGSCILWSTVYDVDADLSYLKILRMI